MQLSVTLSEAVNNRLLAMLDTDVLTRILPKLTPITLESRRPIYAQGGPIDHVYFLTTGMVSMVTNLADGMQAEVGLIGRDGMVGITLISGTQASFVEAMVQMPGTALRLDAKDFHMAFDLYPSFRTALLRYSEAFQAQIMQTAACNGRHELAQRLSRWLLMCQDRQGTDTLPLTQEFIAMMLGVHRPSITVMAGTLQRAGLITYNNGRITIADRPGLEEAACECYAAVRRRNDALFPEAVPG